MIKIGSKVRYTNALSQLSREIGTVKEIEEGDVVLIYYPDLENGELIDNVAFLHNNNRKYNEEKYIWLDIKLLEEVKEDNMFHSSHYEGAIEPIQFIMANKMTFNRGNIIKYATRAGKKSGQEKLDIHKIIDYAMLMAIEENIELDRDELVKLIDYRMNWKKERGDI